MWQCTCRLADILVSMASMLKSSGNTQTHRRHTRCMLTHACLPDKHVTNICFCFAHTVCMVESAALCHSTPVASMPTVVPQQVHLPTNNADILCYTDKSMTVYYSRGVPKDWHWAAQRYAEAPEHGIIPDIQPTADTQTPSS